MSEQPEIKTASDVESGKQQQENNKTNDAEADPDDHLVALSVDDTEKRSISFNTHFNEEVTTREADGAKMSEKKVSVLKPTLINIEPTASIKTEFGDTERPKFLDVQAYSLSPTYLPEIQTPNQQPSVPNSKVDDRKETNPTVAGGVQSPYGSVGLEDHYAARSSYELLSHGSRTTMIIHFSPAESDVSASGVDSAEEMTILEIQTCSGICFAPEISAIDSTRQKASDLRKATQLEIEVDSDDERITEIFGCLRNILQSNTNPEGLENLASLEEAFARKGESKQALSNERDDLVAMHMNFVRRVAEEMSNMKMNPRRWVSLS